MARLCERDCAHRRKGERFGARHRRGPPTEWSGASGAERPSSARLGREVTPLDSPGQAGSRTRASQPPSRAGSRALRHHRRRIDTRLAARRYVRAPPACAAALAASLGRRLWGRPHDRAPDPCGRPWPVGPSRGVPSTRPCGAPRAISLSDRQGGDGLRAVLGHLFKVAAPDAVPAEGCVRCECVAVSHLRGPRHR